MPAQGGVATTEDGVQRGTMRSPGSEEDEGCEEISSRLRPEWGRNLPQNGSNGRRKERSGRESRVDLMHTDTLPPPAKEGFV